MFGALFYFETELFGSVPVVSLKKDFTSDKRNQAHQNSASGNPQKSFGFHINCVLCRRRRSAQKPAGDCFLKRRANK